MSPTTARPTPAHRHRLRHALSLFVVSALLLWAVIAVVPGIDETSEWSVLLAALVIGLVSALLRPALALLATQLGWLGVVLVGLFAQAVIFYAALSLAPGIELSGFWPAFWASWLYAFLVGCVTWVIDANDDEIFLYDVLRQAPRRGPVAPTGEPGVVILQIDGLPAPLLRWAVQAGDLPTLSRWIRSGSHAFVTWRAQLPPTTPASQAGILHGRTDAVPAFRWYEKDSGRLTVTNHPGDAAYVEKGMSDGRGLLADGGVSVGNIFSGDAEHTLLTMSAGRGHGPTRSFTASYMRPFGFTRSLLLTLGEMVKEVYQGHRQKSRDIQPRIDRFSSYVALRGVTNVLLRDLNVRLLAEQMVAGTPVMYCDFTDYDEVAHHAGPTRPESVASLVGVDRAIAVLERVSAVAPRPYRFVVLSDHGQSQGATFRQRYGEPLEAVVRRLMHSPDPSLGDNAATVAVASTDREEEWGPITTFLREVATGHGPLATAGRRMLHRRDARKTPPVAQEQADVIVTGSGNLAFVYFPAQREHVSWERLDLLHPGLVESLAEHDGVGFVVVRSEQHGTVAIGSGGRHFLDEERLEGLDPLVPFGPKAAVEVRRHARLAHVGDIIVNSRIDEATGEVAAFEELVGCHGGLGGWQGDAVLIHPADWSPPAPIDGADALHRQLVRWLEDVGQRKRLAGAGGEAPCG